MSERILVTGGAGYVGSILVPSLLEKGYQVAVIDNFMYRQTALLNVCHHRNLEIVRGDARNETLLKFFDTENQKIRDEMIDEIFQNYSRERSRKRLC